MSQVKERPILFSGPMVRAILEGRKTQTRRIAKSQRNKQGLKLCFDLLSKMGVGHACPYGAVGDRLWVRETWSKITISNPYRVLYQADGKDSKGQNGWDTKGPWKPSIHMPRAASRITLEITAVRIERLNDISATDAVAEGIERLFDIEEVVKNPSLEVPSRSWKNYLWHGHFGDSGLGNKKSDAWDFQFSGYLPSDPVGSYSSLWESINGAGSWAANPWVWVVEFKVLPR